jgi:hypothetical protein
LVQFLPQARLRAPLHHCEPVALLAAGIQHVEKRFVSEPIDKRRIGRERAEVRC